MRKLCIFLWLLLPVAAGAYHFGPGQDRLHDDRAADALGRAEAAATRARAIAATEGDAAARNDWAEAEAAYGEALAELPSDRIAEARVLRLERAKAQMFVAALPEARADLAALVDELVADPQADPALLGRARDAFANAQYYTTWLMRLEGRPREDWEREVDSSRQNYTLLVDEAERAGDASAVASARENLESAIRLARMDLDELQGLPLPSQ
jgi:hypothetical protein